MYGLFSKYRNKEENLTEPTESLGDYDVNKVVDPGNFDVTEGGVGLYARRGQYEVEEDPIKKLKKAQKKKGRGVDESDDSQEHRSFDSRDPDSVRDSVASRRSNSRSDRSRHSDSRSDKSSDSDKSSSSSSSDDN